MDSDFIIFPPSEKWKAVAVTERARALAANDPRFEGTEAKLDPAEALAMYQELHDRGYYSTVADGLPPPNRGLILSRLALLIAPIVIVMVLLALAT
jgi:hypothetical protein